MRRRSGGGHGSVRFHGRGACFPVSEGARISGESALRPGRNVRAWARAGPSSTRNARRGKAGEDNDIVILHTSNRARTDGMYLPKGKRLSSMTLEEASRGLCPRSGGDSRVCRENCPAPCGIGRWVLFLEQAKQPSCQQRER